MQSPGETENRDPGVGMSVLLGNEGLSVAPDTFPGDWREFGERWIWCMDCWMGEELHRWPHLKGYGQWPNGNQ